MWCIPHVKCIFINIFILLEFCTIYFELFHLLQLLPVPLSPSSHPFPPNFKRTYLSSIESSLYCPDIVLGVGPALMCEQSTRDHLIKEKWTLFPQQLSNANFSTASSGITWLVLSSLVHAVTIIVWSYVHLPCYVWKVSLSLSPTSGSYSLPNLSSAKIPGPWGKGCDRNLQFGAEHSIVFCSLHTVLLDVCVNSI